MSKINVQNPYSQFNYRNGYGSSAIVFGSSLENEIPDPSKYLLGSWSPQYQADLNRYNHEMQSAQWDAQLALMADERQYAEDMYNKYNSPAAQARQMREAGINPDLQGVQSTGFSAPQGSSPQLGIPAMSTEEPFSLKFLKAIPQAVQMVTSLQSSVLDSQFKQLSIDAKMDELAFSDIASALSPDMFNSEGKFIGKRDSEPFNIVRDRSMLLRDGYSPRFDRSYKNAIERYFTSNFNEHYKDMYLNRQGGASARKGYLDVLSSFGMNLSDNAFVQVLREYNDIVFNTRKKRAKSDSLASDNDIIPALMSKANKKLESNDKGENFVGAILYFLATIMQGNVSINRDSKGNLSGSLGF